MGSTAKKRTSNKRNVTLRVRSDVLAAARQLAAQKESSLSELFEQFTEAASARPAAEDARKRTLIQLAQQGFSLGGGPYLTDDEIYSR